MIREVENVGNYERTNEIVSITCTDIHDDLYQNETFRDAEKREHSMFKDDIFLVLKIKNISSTTEFESLLFFSWFKG